MDATWLKLLPLELQETTELIEPFIEIQPDDNVVSGEMSEGLKKLYTMWISMKKMADQAQLDCKYSDSPDIHKKAIEYSMKAGSLFTIFAVCISEEHDLWLNGPVLVRKGWTVVWRKPENIFPFFQGFSI